MYTPKFQAILDACDELRDKCASTDEIGEFFREKVRMLGPYERLNNLYRIRPKRAIPGETSRFQFFKMNKMQDAYYQARTNRDMVLKMRQGGVTTLSCLEALDICLWTHNSNTAIMAHVRDNVKQFFRITKNAFQCFQKDWGQLYPVSTTTDNVNELKIQETGSQLLVCTETKGLTLDFLHISEVGFVENSRISESLESVPLSGRVVLETTPNTAQGLFYEMWELYEKQQGCLFTGHFFPWWFQYPEKEDLCYLKADKDFQFTEEELALVKLHNLTKEHILWRRAKISECGGDVGEFRRKYPEDSTSCWLSGANGVFPAGLLGSLLKNERPPAFVGDLQIAT